MVQKGGRYVSFAFCAFAHRHCQIATKEIGSDAVNRASSVEVFFVDAELVGDEFDGSR